MKLLLDFLNAFCYIYKKILGGWENMSGESKRERFIRIVERRVNKIFDDFDSLGKCSNKRNYQYSEEDAKKIFQAIEKKMKIVRASFSNSIKSKNRFTLK